MRLGLFMAGTPQPDSYSESAGDFESLLISHQQRIYFFIRTMVFQPDDARDVLQDVNAVIIRKREHFILGTDFKSWAFAIARYECLAYLQRHKRSVVGVLDEGVAELLADRAEQRADDMDAWLKALAVCRQGLPSESAELLQMRYEQRIALESIAERWSTTVGALKQKLFRVRAQLRECVMKRLGKSTAGPDA